MRHNLSIVSDGLPVATIPSHAGFKRRERDSWSTPRTAVDGLSDSAQGLFPWFGYLLIFAFNAMCWWGIIAAIKHFLGWMSS